ncbi:MAG: hypothetical protein J4F36_12280 [Nitrosopumilaceae archaeon]|nr:hypothetical protein [Nitrosopumilaceae archaeon]
MANKTQIAILVLASYCTVIASLVTIFFLAPMMQFGGGPFGMGAPPNIPDDVLNELKSEIEQRESVITFKDTFPDYRENFKESYGLEYHIQARNQNTGNVLALFINYHPMGPPGTTDKFQDNENLECIPGKGIVGSQDMMSHMMRFGGADLFIHEQIKTTDCLDDDWQPSKLVENPQ